MMMLFYISGRGCAWSMSYYMQVRPVSLGNHFLPLLLPTKQSDSKAHTTSMINIFFSNKYLTQNLTQLEWSMQAYVWASYKTMMQ